MHYTCVPSAAPGAGQQCPICKDEKGLREVTQDDSKLPYWHEAELGGRFKGKVAPEVGSAPFPALRWPTSEEAALHGYRAVEDWYVDYRLGAKKKNAENLAKTRAEFKELELARKPKEPDLEEDEDIEAPSVSAVVEQQSSLGTAETGRMLADYGQYSFASVGPLSWKRVERISDIREELSKTCKLKWAEATSGPAASMPEVLKSVDPSYRQKLKIAQTQCKEVRALVDAQKHLLGAAAKDSTKAAEEMSKDYRLSPEDTVLERSVMVTRAQIWVPVMPNVKLPDGVEQDITWRRWAFERAHCTFLDPHRSPGPTWQTLKRIAFWCSIRLDFEMWIHLCAVCHQYRTVGQLAPMRSMLASVPEINKLPWSDVIIDCQGPFTTSARGNCYTVSYHCTSLGVPKVEPFARLRKAEFLIALVACVMRARRVPDIVRMDRGPEMTSSVMEEFLTLCNAKQYLGAAFTPST
jgi:hypothetical protein